MSAKLDEMWAALEAYQPTADADEGVNWDVIEHTAQDMYPKLRYKA